MTFHLQLGTVLDGNEQVVDNLEADRLALRKTSEFQKACVTLLGLEASSCDADDSHDEEAFAKGPAAKAGVGTDNYDGHDFELESCIFTKEQACASGKKWWGGQLFYFRQSPQYNFERHYFY